mmetsp:Transcript_27020/g.56845  ORF Transcript_27020/g.56845 Transcript_27020/m.56845 type:complete len:202 (-) Transcript_27020:330-935(-)
MGQSVQSTIAIIIAALAVAYIPTLDGSATSPQISPNADNSMSRQLQFFDPIALANSAINGTCPEGCFLCECTDSEDPECLLQSSIRSCQEKTLAACYSNFLPGGTDISGLCASQCDEGAQPSLALTEDLLRSVCRLCEIFTCCETCPAERIPECFPSNLDEGYTPPDWEPATCLEESSAVIRAIGSAFILGFTVFVFMIEA